MRCFSAPLDYQLYEGSESVSTAGHAHALCQLAHSKGTVSICEMNIKTQIP